MIKCGYQVEKILKNNDIMKPNKVVFYDLKTPENVFICSTASAFCREVGLNPASFRTWLQRNNLKFKEDVFHYHGYVLRPAAEVI